MNRLFQTSMIAICMESLVNIVGDKGGNSIDQNHKCMLTNVDCTDEKGKHWTIMDREIGIGKKV